MTKPVWQSGGGEGGGFEAEFEAGEDAAKTRSRKIIARA
jgi:hypothetical protein